MTKKVLNNVDHRDLRVDARPHRRYGDCVNRALVFATEYGDLQREFPILIWQNTDSQEFEGHVILGLEKDENLFIEGGEWRTRFVPASLARGPFSIGYQRRQQEDSESAAIVVMVDEDHPRCGAKNGEAVFLEHGGESPYLEYIRKVLQKIEDGLRADRYFFGLLRKLDLLEPVSIKLSLTEEKQIAFNGYHTINQERLANLDGSSLKELNRAGVLGLIFYLTSSLGNFQNLIGLKNASSSMP